MTEFHLGEHVTVSHRLSRIPYSAVRHPDFTKPGGGRTLPDRLEAVKAELEKEYQCESGH